jgi:hypothetical protein
MKRHLGLFAALMACVIVAVSSFRSKTNFPFRHGLYTQLGASYMEVPTPSAEVAAADPDPGCIVDAAAKRLSQRFYEIDLRTKDSMNRILSLYEVTYHMSVKMWV